MTSQIADSFDIVVIGTGMGGSSMVNALAKTGKNILVLERGDFLPCEPENMDSQAIFVDERYKTEESWFDDKGKAFTPGNYYYVGGNTKFYGAVLIRFRKEDFKALQHEEGISPAWPFEYEDLEQYYTQAEELYGVCGKVGEDPTDPARSRNVLRPAVPDEVEIADLRERLRRCGVNPFSLPLAIDIDRWTEQTHCPWDAYPNADYGKGDAEIKALNPVLNKDNITLWRNARVTRLLTHQENSDIDAVELEHEGEKKKINAKLVVLCAGAINSAALLLNSKNKQYPDGLANSSGMVGKNFMNHNCTAMLAINPMRKNSSVYQKTLGINDYYLANDDHKYPLGNIQLLGKINEDILKANIPFVPNWILRYLTDHSVDWYLMSEDLPSAENRIVIEKEGQITLKWKPSNMNAHRRLVLKTKQLMRRSGYPVILTKAFDKRTPSHQCGTVRIGDNSLTAPLDPYCRSYDHKNLFVVDGGFLPSSSALNPALTIAAQALRVAEHIANTNFQGISY